MPKAVRQIPVGTLIKNLTTEGYAAANSLKEDRIDVLRQNFHVALRLAKSLGAHRNTVDFVLRDYVARSKRTSWIMHTIALPSPHMMLEFARLGASRSTVELLTKEFARQGITGSFLAATKMLKREPKEDEVAMLVKDYVDGATEGRDTEEKLIGLAQNVSRKFGEHIARQIEERRRRWALSGE